MSEQASELNMQVKLGYATKDTNIITRWSNQEMALWLVQISVVILISSRTETVCVLVGLLAKQHCHDVIYLKLHGD